LNALDYHESAYFKGAGNFFLRYSQQELLRGLGRLNAGVMRRFERVVALPEPKDIEFPQPQATVYFKANA